MHQYNIIAGRNHAIRRANRHDFLYKKTGEKGDQKISVLILCYNDTTQFFHMLDRLEKETKGNEFMITIVQNSDREDSKKIFDERIAHYTNITVLYPISNLGSAGGYALGQEYILSQGYEHIIMLEDDVELYEEDTIGYTLDHINDNKGADNLDEVLFIKAPVNTGGEHSWYVQYACYPTDLLRRTGVIDPRYYFRAEDLEWGKRIEDAIKQYGYEKTILNRRYYHPYLKGVNNSGSWIYFSLRNQLRTFRKHKEGLIRILMTLALYAAFGLLVLFRTGKTIILTCVRKGFSDGIKSYRPLEYHSMMIEQLARSQKTTIQDIGFAAHDATFSTLEIGVNNSHPIAKTSLSAADRKHLDGYKGTLLVSGGFQPVWGTLIACFTKVLVIESFHWDKKLLTGKMLHQKIESQIVNMLLFLPCVLLGSLAAFVASIWLLGVTYLK